MAPHFDIPFIGRIPSPSRTTRIIIVLMIIAVIIAVLQFSNLLGTVELCDLWDDCQLRKTEIHRIQLALSQAGLNDFEITDKALLVPRSQRDKYLQAIDDHGAVPDRLAPQKEFSPHNPFWSRTQQISVEREQKQQRIREMVQRLPFVDEAWFVVDVAQAGSAFDPIHRTCGVIVRPRENLTLSREQVGTIRKMISGFIAGIDPQKIVVTDLNSGDAYSAGDQAKITERNQLALAAAREVKLTYEHRIRQALTVYNGLQIEVHCQSAAPLPAGLAQEQLASNSRQPLPERLPAGVNPPTIMVAANGQASLAPDSSDGLAGNNEPAGFAEIDSNRTVRPLQDPRVSVSIGVPSALLKQRHGEQQQLTTTWPGQSPRPSQDIDSTFEQLKSEIVEKIRPLLPISSFDNPAVYPISVTRLPAAGSGQAREAREARKARSAARRSEIVAFAQSQWATIAVLAIGISLLIIASIRPYPVQNELANTGPASTATSPPESSDNTNILAMKEQISQLIDRDPDTAANVLKKWIRDAA